jgi:hypothetical protein
MGSKTGMQKFDLEHQIKFWYKHGFHYFYWLPACVKNQSMLTEDELSKVFSWQPYRSDWPVDRNNQDGIEAHYGALMTDIKNTTVFEAIQTQDGGMGNCLEFICWPKGKREYNGPAVAIYISLCAPIAAYGSMTLYKDKKSLGWGFIDAAKVGVITVPELTVIEKEIISILSKHKLGLMDKEFASRPLSNEVADELESENLHFGHQYLHGIFQWTD